MPAAALATFSTDGFCVIACLNNGKILAGSASEASTTTTLLLLNPGFLLVMYCVCSRIIRVEIINTTDRLNCRVTSDFVNVFEPPMRSLFLKTSNGLKLDNTNAG